MSGYRTVSLDEVMAKLPPERQQRIKQKTEQILLEQATLRELRNALGVTQEKLAKSLDVAQENVSRLEDRNDPKLSTLAAYVKALGGTLELQAVFPDGSTVKLRRASAAIKRAGARPNRVKITPAEPVRTGHDEAVA
ncbi:MULTISPECIES: helix-turn-helix domain-containing protein [Methylorubrum]|uniref:Transcriptional regulator n=3 Tax=Alphaproteobacteria TaxID=28211 RepID=C5B6T1_METEA|nr:MULTISPECIES: helix-turn-helix transcriptional regulator [Bacteria]MBL7309121.1 helix-turn-helix transcriptional regulator [Escherichia coli]MDV2988280.1 helix-turn-helix transcriptional regulator [Methylobacteriaceae bacterium AG10]ACS44163.1 Putative transcriptional regulator [Methylorubrum extorquens AM1]MBD8907767.1 transcriptional regulator [Methylorubrum zatmanii]MBL7405209.1 helix-turn-helix transcriptional regulator [Escherichia coli]